MTIDKPVWLDYAVWEDVGGYPQLIGLKKDTPKEIVEQFKKDQEEYKKAEEDGILL